MKDADGEMLGGGIADFDTASGEMSLEWIQVLPAFRRLGYGKRIVDELLRRGREIAAFATVCGKSCGGTVVPRLRFYGGGKTCGM